MNDVNCLTESSQPPLLRGFSGWRRRADSNRRIQVLQTRALDHLATPPFTFYPFV